jgi:putative transposase
MNRKEAQAIEVGEKVGKVLGQVVRETSSPYWLVTRAKVILRAAGGGSNSQIGREMGLTRNTVIKWRGRWGDNQDRVDALEDAAVSEKDVREAVETILADAPRSGTPPTFTAEQVVQIVAIACEDPAQSGRPVTHWTPEEVADEAIRRGVVESISPRQVGRFLKRGGAETASEPLLVESWPGPRSRPVRC